MKAVVRIMLCVALLTLIGVPLSAQIIEQGTDLWRTRGDGSTFASFAIEPLPAGFFCAGSAPFAGEVVFRGVPVAAEPAGVLGFTDTVIHRLDDAKFNTNGVATTRIQMRAMAFEGVELLRNECGTFHVGVELDGEQPITDMKIVREEANGGRFVAPIHVNVNITFTPVDHGGETLRIPRQLRFGAAANAVWSRRPDVGFAQVPGEFLVDTDNDGSVDTVLPGTSRAFFAGSTAGLDRSRGPLHRRQGLSAENGVDVAGTLKDGNLERAAGVSNTAGALASTTSISSEPVPICHIEDSCNHCPDGTTTAVY